MTNVTSTAELPARSSLDLTWRNPRVIKAVGDVAFASLGVEAGLGAAVVINQPAFTAYYHYSSEIDTIQNEQLAAVHSALSHETQTGHELTVQLASSLLGPSAQRQEQRLARLKSHEPTPPTPIVFGAELCAVPMAGAVLGVGLHRLLRNSVSRIRRITTA